MKKPGYSAAYVIAFHFSWDIDDVRHYRYQPTMRPGMAIYSIDEDYFCCPPAGKKPMYGKEFPWKPLAEYFGRTIYHCTSKDIAAHNDL